MTIVQSLPQWLGRLRALMPALQRLGVAPRELARLAQDMRLIQVVDAASRQRGDVGPHHELQCALDRLERRLERITQVLPGAPRA